MSDENLYSAPDADVDIAQTDELAGRGARLVAVLIDGLLMAALMVTFMFLSGSLERQLNETSMTTQLASTLLGMAVFLAINGYLLATSGQTIGKKLLGIKIVSISDGEILPFLRVVGLRYIPLWVVQAIPLIGAIVALVNALFIFRSDRRCIHDLIASTRVVKV